MKRTLTPLLLLAVAALSPCTSQPRNQRDDAWPQWGGPLRNFAVTSGPLAATWPKDGPPRLWHRPLGEGYSGIVSDGRLAFTMYRPKGTTEEVVIAIDAKTGETVWEDRLESESGGSPNATPLIAGDRIYAISSKGVVRALDKATGKLFWTRDLQADFKATDPGGHGFCISPVAYGDTLIIPLGARSDREEEPDGRDRSIIALRMDDGELAWKGGEYVVAQSSPTLINHGGQDQIVLLMNDTIAAVDPNSGKELWRLGFESSDTHSITPLWNGEDLFVFSAGGGSGRGRGIRLVREGGKTVPQLAWVSPEMRSMIYQGVHSDGVAYMSGNAGFFGYDLGTGEQLWKHGAINKSPSCILADGKLLILHSDGELTLATPSREELTIHSQFQVAEPDALTSPALVGGTLFIRDLKHIMAFDVGVPSETDR